MKAPELYRLLNLFSLLTSQRALSVNYRVIALSRGFVRGCAPFGCMQIAANLGELPDEVYIDANNFLQVLRSLPDSEFEILSTDSNALRWKCGSATKGHLTLLTENISIPLPEYSGEVSDQVVPRAFGEGLELGALACGSMAMRTLGLEGVQLRNRDGKTYAYSSDDTTIGRCCLGEAIAMPQPREVNDPYAGTITLKPEAANLLAALIKRDGEALVATNSSSVYCVTSQVELLLNQNAPMRHDLAGIAGGLATAELKMPLFREAVSAFLKRSQALADGQAMVSIAVQEGRTSLSFNEIAGSTEEYYIVEGQPTINVPPVRLEAHRMAKALEYATDMAFDYAEARNTLVLHGPREFMFCIHGRAELEV